MSGQTTQYPSAMMSAVMALDYYLNDKIEIVVVGQGDERDRMIAHLWTSYLPNRIIAVSDHGRDRLPLFEERASVDGVTRAYVCRNSVCHLPATTVDELRDHLSRI